MAERETPGGPSFDDADVQRVADLLLDSPAASDESTPEEYLADLARQAGMVVAHETMPVAFTLMQRRRNQPPQG